MAASMAIAAISSAAPVIGASLVRFGATELPSILQGLSSALPFESVLNKGIQHLISNATEDLKPKVDSDEMKDVLASLLKLNAFGGDSSTKEWLKTSAMEKIKALVGEGGDTFLREAQKTVNAFMEATVSVASFEDEVRVLEQLQKDASFRYKIHSDLGERNDRLSKWLAIPMAIISAIISLTSAPTAFNDVPGATKFVLAIVSTVLSIVVGIFSVLINNIEPGQKAGKHLAVATTYHQIRQSLRDILTLKRNSNQSLLDDVKQFQKRMSEAEKMCPLKWENPETDCFKEIFQCLLPFPQQIKNAYRSYNDEVPQASRQTRAVDQESGIHTASEENPARRRGRSSWSFSSFFQKADPI